MIVPIRGSLTTLMGRQSPQAPVRPPRAAGSASNHNRVNEPYHLIATTNARLSRRGLRYAGNVHREF
jgi:hypothetical protein